MVSLIFTENPNYFQEDFNVILVDWEGGANVWLWQYEGAASNTRVVGAYLAKILELLEKTGYPMENVHCVGHSLGAQTCGFAGKLLHTQMARITGVYCGVHTFRILTPVYSTVSEQPSSLTYFSYVFRLNLRIHPCISIEHSLAEKVELGHILLFGQVMVSKKYQSYVS